jgi:hypothetical protein
MWRTLELSYRWAIYCTDLDDGSGSRNPRASSLSATKLCGYLCVFAGLLIAILQRAATVNGNTLVAMGMTALFGRMMWKNWLGRNTWTSTAAEVHETRESHEILERRDVGQGFEATP